jgi:hypothetical protein
MNSYRVRVRLASGGFTSVVINADNQHFARQLVEGAYGAGSFIAVLEQL